MKLRTCNKCHRKKPLTEFSRFKNGKLMKRCNNCRKYRLHPPGFHRERRYGLTPEAYQLLHQNQGGKCAICHQPKELVVDHNHETGEIRGLLCRSCNLGCGYFHDNSKLTQSATRYLTRR